MNKKMTRKLTAGLAAITMLASAVPFFGMSASADEVKYGDVNKDGIVDVMDVIRINRFLLGSVELDDAARKNADVDQNGEINATDSLDILKYVVGTINTLPVNGGMPTDPVQPDEPQPPVEETTEEPTEPPVQQPSAIKDYGTPMNANATMVSDFRTGDPGDFFASDGWTNGSCFDCWWYESNTSLDGGMLTLTIDQDKGNKGMYSGAEYRTNEFYSYGYYEVSMQAIKNDGVVSSFFTYTGPSDKINGVENPWDEIDIEILGKDTTKVQLNYYKNGQGGHEYMYDLGFDAAEGFHTYGFDWQPDHITWYVDGKEAYTMRGDMPVTAGKIMMNTWPGVSDPSDEHQVIDWLKSYDGTTPISAHYQWATYDKNGKNGSSQPQQPTEQPQQPTEAPTEPPVQQPSSIKDYGTPMNANATMVSDFRKNAGDFFASDGWTNGACFDCWWHKSNTSLDGGMLTLTIDQDKGGKGMYSGAEYRTNEFYSYGYYEVSMQAIKNDGVVSSFFTYTGPSDKINGVENPWDEIDIEILGKDTTKVQLNYYKNGQGGHEYMYDLGFDASEGFHTYGFDWQPDHITWYVDGKEAYTMRGDMPVTAGKIMMNTWPGVSDPNNENQVIGWLKAYDGKTPISAHYQWATYDKNGKNGSSQPQQPTEQPQQPSEQPQQPSNGIKDYGTPMNQNAQMKSDFRTGNAGDFFASDGWTNGACFDCWWHKSNTSLDGGMLTLTIDQDKGGKGMYSGAEYRTNEFYSYGYYETSMQAIKNDGVVSSFFTYTGPSDKINGVENPWDEIDIEILGKDTTKVQLNYYKNGQGGHEYMYDLDFDASEGFHTYGFDWQPDHITWYVDGKEAYTMWGDMPKTAGKIMMNTWPGVSDPNNENQVIDWLKAYDGKTPISAHYQWVTYNPTR